jgi:MFS transporter, MHS family, proline/betaine transporter
VVVVATGGMLILAWPLFWMMDSSAIFSILLGQIGFAVLSACFSGVAPAVMVELVPYQTRCTVLSLGYNTAMAILGGLTPMIAVYTLNRTHYDLFPAFLLMAAAAISLIVVLGLRETYKLPLVNPTSALSDAAWGDNTVQSVVL